MAVHEVYDTLTSQWFVTLHLLAQCE